MGDFFEIFFLLRQRAFPVGDTRTGVVEREQGEIFSGKRLGNLLVQLEPSAENQVEGVKSNGAKSDHHSGTDDAKSFF